MITYRRSRQLELFKKSKIDGAENQIIGYGSEKFYIEEIDRDLAVKTIKENHYSKKVVNSSRIHLGVFMLDELVGVLQFGYLFNPTYHDKIVEGGESENAMELNRMWLDDKAPRNSESKAISYCIKLIKKRFPKIKWIQSFADERSNGFGIVYQACSFSYYGEHKGEFYELDGEIYHSIQTRRKDNNSKLTVYLRKNKHKMKKLILRQFRYIRFLDKRWKSKCLLEEKKYPKHYNND